MTRTDTVRSIQGAAMKNIGIFCSSSSQIDPKYLNEGRAIGEAIGKAGKTMVYG